MHVTGNVRNTWRSQVAASPPITSYVCMYETRRKPHANTRLTRTFTLYKRTTFQNTDTVTALSAGEGTTRRKPDARHLTQLGRLEYSSQFACISLLTQALRGGAPNKKPEKQKKKMNYKEQISAGSHRHVPHPLRVPVMEARPSGMENSLISKAQRSLACAGRRKHRHQARQCSDGGCVTGRCQSASLVRHLTPRALFCSTRATYTYWCYLYIFLTFVTRNMPHSSMPVLYALFVAVNLRAPIFVDLSIVN
jgi:hypothetical protein